MNYAELTKLLKRAGWEIYRNGKGSHVIWCHPNRPDTIPVPNHGSKEISPNLVRGILKQAGLK